MNVVDSSGWLEYFAAGRNGEAFAPAIRDTGALVVPTVCIYEVFKHILARRGDGEMLGVVALVALDYAAHGQRSGTGEPR